MELRDMDSPTNFKVLIVATRAKDHLAMAAAARPFFDDLATDGHYSVDFTDDAEKISDENLAQYQVFVMLHLAPFDMTADQQRALQTFIEGGGGWVGIHAAGLTGRQFVGSGAGYWDWFETFMGGVTYSPHPAYQKGEVVVEDRRHPSTRNLPARFEFSDEWYEFDRSPRDRVRVLATADESTYTQRKPMGDHPIVWVNERYRRAIYIAIGHDPTALENKDYVVLLRDSILWASSQQ